MWWRGPRVIRLKDAAIGLALFAGLAGLGWLLRWIIIYTWSSWAGAMYGGHAASEPTRMQRYGEQVGQFFGAYEMWLVGAGLAFLTLNCVWEVLAYILDWKQSKKTMTHPLDSWRVCFYLLGIIGLGTCLLIWIQSMM